MSSAAQNPKHQSQPPKPAAPPRSDFAAYEDPAQYLLAKGWRPLGNVQWESCLWLDPTQPLAAQSREEPIEADFEEQETYKDQDGRQRTRIKIVRRQLTVQDAQGNLNVVQAKRLVKTAAAVPVGLQQAVHTQIERDMREAKPQAATA